MYNFFLKQESIIPDFMNTPRIHVNHAKGYAQIYNVQFFIDVKLVIKQ